MCFLIRELVHQKDVLGLLGGRGPGSETLCIAIPDRTYLLGLQTISSLGGPNRAAGAVRFAGAATSTAPGPDMAQLLMSHSHAGARADARGRRRAQQRAAEGAARAGDRGADHTRHEVAVGARRRRGGVGRDRDVP